MAEREKEQYDALMAEYKELRSEVAAYSQRIDRTIGVYLSALFALFGFLLRPDGNFSLPAYIASVQASPSLTGAFLAIGFLNCLLLARVQSFYLAVLALSQFTATVSAPRVSALVGKPVLTWDEPESIETKRHWLPVRTVAQSGFALLAIALTVFVAWVAVPVNQLPSLWIASLCFALACGIVYNLYVFGRIVQVGRNFHQNAELHKLARTIELERRDA